MKMNTNSNSYIIIYSAILVVIVAFLLAFVYKALKPMQDANSRLTLTCRESSVRAFRLV